jgi:predicted TPR repeat methyltransferase
MTNINNQLNQEALVLQVQAEQYIKEDKLIEAENKYKELLKLIPNHYQTLINLGYILFRQNKLDESKEVLNQALEIDDENYDIYFMLGKIYKINNNLEDATKCFEWAIDIEPKFQLAYVELFESLFRLKKLNDIDSYIKKAIENFGESTDFYYQIANYYLELEDLTNAKKYLELSINLDIDFAPGYETLGNVNLKLKDKESAIKSFKELKRLEPENPILYILDALENKDLSTAPKEYVKNLFDFFAENFDTKLLNLQYSAPNELLKLLQEKTDINLNKKSVLDLGCGTGLFGKEIKPYATNLIGVDLSEKMLEKANNLNIYDQLENSDLIEYLTKENNTYDLMSSTDVFIYVGKLDEIFKEVNRLLTDSGLFTFSLESLEHFDSKLKQDLKLTETGRYVHSIEYINRLAKENNLTNLITEVRTIRVENGNPVIGYLCILQKDNNQDKNAEVVVEQKPAKKGLFSKIFGN